MTGWHSCHNHNVWKPFVDCLNNNDEEFVLKSVPNSKLRYKTHALFMIKMAKIDTPLWPKRVKNHTLPFEVSHDLSSDQCIIFEDFVKGLHDRGLKRFKHGGSFFDYGLIRKSEWNIIRNSHRVFNSDSNYRFVLCLFHWFKKRFTPKKYLFP